MGRQIKYNKAELEEAVSSSKSWMEVQRKLGLKVGGGSHQYVQTKARYWGIDASHFTGQAWNKGLTEKDHESISKAIRTVQIPDEEIFVENCRPITGPALIKRLMRLGWEYKCRRCGIEEWLGRKITLHLDHINGVHNDNRTDNLRLLCPNCHQQTETWGNRKK